MGIGSFLREAQEKIFEQQHCGVLVPNPATDRVCLLRPGFSLTEASPRAAFIAREVVSDGYSRSVLGRQITAIADNTLTIPEHGINNGDRVFLVVSSGGAAPDGLEAGKVYYVLNKTDNTLQLARISGGSAVTVSSSGSGSLYLRPGGSFDITENAFEGIFNPARLVNSGATTLSFGGYFVLRGAAGAASIEIASVDTGSDQMTTSAAHDLATGDEVVITADDSGTMPTGIASETVYFARVVSEAVLTLHPTAEDAAGNTNKLNLTTAGTLLRLRYANGYVEGFELFATAQNILAGKQQIIRIYHSIGALNG